MLSRSRHRWALSLLACAAVWTGAAAAQRTEPGPPVCDSECTEFGNCGEDGHCRCPFGRLGKNCEVDFLNPCRPAPDWLPNCGAIHTKSCECLRRCQAYFCRKDSNGTELCSGLAYHLTLHNDIHCYEREGVAPDEQYSTIPEPEEKCPKKCNGSGYCGKFPHEPKPSCHCHRGYWGQACEL
ncbi:exostosin-like glycosyltransferase [Micractinium conductrix]|uniref:Exostosin-like glycosyltransferase n=1 Tax=Micractinium conductrix TaxID=554055 RepID=A0A2P6UZK5_9CHLO|nr:exostosin-like glycosyltransferase [Micractinium conductrix]|eukprot:PSC67270.1 exostosin-like glycosyltransferase [Micractinium conductrix]